MKVIEIAPPYVPDGVDGGAARRMIRMRCRWGKYIAETMRLLGTDSDEAMVENVMERRKNLGPNEWEFINKFNDLMVQQRGE